MNLTRIALAAALVASLGACTDRQQAEAEDAARKTAAAAKDVAATLGLPPTAVKKGKVPANPDIAVTLGKDYKPPTQ